MRAPVRGSGLYSQRADVAIRHLTYGGWERDAAEPEGWARWLRDEWYVWLTRTREAGAAEVVALLLLRRCLAGAHPAALLGELGIRPFATDVVRYACAWVTASAPVALRTALFRRALSDRALRGSPGFDRLCSQARALAETVPQRWCSGLQRPEQRRHRMARLYPGRS